MSPSDQKLEAQIRLLFELSRDDNPRLFDDLMRFKKGTKRVNRLRFLANEGLVVEVAWSARDRSVPTTTRATQGGLPEGFDPLVARHTNQVFSLQDDDTPG